MAFIDVVDSRTGLTCSIPEEWESDPVLGAFFYLVQPETVPATFEGVSRLTVACTHPATPSEGDPVLFGQLPGVALADEADGLTLVGFDDVVSLSVKGINAAGNVAIAAGDPVFYVTTDTPVLNAKVRGVFFGYAVDPVTSGATTTIRVKIGA